ncbi:MAG: hypothetical protein ACK47B_21720 [Armatimonadota bacterium]
MGHEASETGMVAETDFEWLAGTLNLTGSVRDVLRCRMVEELEPSETAERLGLTRNEVDRLLEQGQAAILGHPWPRDEVAEVFAEEGDRRKGRHGGRAWHV